MNKFRNNPFSSGSVVVEQQSIESIKKEISDSISTDNRLIFVNNEKSQIDDLNEETLDSLKRTLEMLLLIENTSESIIVELDEQSFKIRTAELDLEEISENNKKASMYIKSIKSFFGTLANKFTLKGRTISSTNSMPPTSPPPSLTQKSPPPTSPPPTSPPQNAEDEYLDQIEHSLRKLNQMGLDMKTEIDDQNKRLNSLTNNVVCEDLQLRKNIKDINTLL